jgi:hypothetical protein
MLSGLAASPPGGGDDEPIIRLTASELAAIVAAGRNHDHQTRDNRAHDLVHGAGWRSLDRCRSAAQAAVKRTLRGDLLWLVLAIFLLLPFVKLATNKPEVLAFSTDVERTVPFPVITEWK